VWLAVCLSFRFLFVDCACCADTRLCPQSCPLLCRYVVGSFQPSRQIFQSPVSLSAGDHVINIAEREDGTRVQSLTLTQGMNTCRFVAPPPRCTGLPGATAVVGCAQINGFAYFATPAPGYAMAPVSGSGTNGGCLANGSMSGGTSGDAVCGTLTFNIVCQSATLLQATVSAQAFANAGEIRAPWCSTLHFFSRIFLAPSSSTTMTTWCDTSTLLLSHFLVQDHHHHLQKRRR
jgi:hypothetical protein